MHLDPALAPLAAVEARWRPWSWWGSFGWWIIVVPTVVACTVIVAVSGNWSGAAGLAAIILFLGLLLMGTVALVVRAVLRHRNPAGQAQLQLGRQRPQRARRRRIWGAVQFTITLIVLEGALILFSIHGWHNLNNQLIRHAAGTQRLQATVTSIDKQCARGGCNYTSYGDYSVNGSLVQHVELVSETDDPKSGEVTVLVNPAHPRRAVWIHDHGQAWITIGVLCALTFVVGNPLWLWLRGRDTGTARHAAQPGNRTDLRDAV